MLFDTDAVLEVHGRGPARRRSTVRSGCSAARSGSTGPRRPPTWPAASAPRSSTPRCSGPSSRPSRASLVFLAAGAEELRDRVAPAFDAMGSKTIWVSEEPGRGSALKLVCNAFVGTLTAAVGQSVGLATQLGLDPQLFLDALDGGASDSPYVHVKGAMMLARRVPAVVRARRRPQGPRPHPRGGAAVRDADRPRPRRCSPASTRPPSRGTVPTTWPRSSPRSARADRSRRRRSRAEAAAQLSAAVRTAACSSRVSGSGSASRWARCRRPTSSTPIETTSATAPDHVRGGRAERRGEHARERRGDGAADEADAGVGRRRDRAGQLGGLHHRLGQDGVHDAEEQPAADRAADQHPEAVHEQGHRGEVEGQQHEHRVEGALPAEPGREPRRGEDRGDRDAEPPAAEDQAELVGAEVGVARRLRRGLERERGVGEQGEEAEVVEQRGDTEGQQRG